MVVFMTLVLFSLPLVAQEDEIYSHRLDERRILLQGEATEL